MKHLTFTQRTLLLALNSLIGGASLNLPALADIASTPITPTINPGLLTLTPATHVDLSSVTLSHTQGQTSTGNIGLVLIDDSRGTYAGWSATATFGNLISISL